MCHVHQKIPTASESPGTSVLKDQESAAFTSNIRSVTDVTESALTASQKEIKTNRETQRKKKALNQHMV